MKIFVAGASGAIGWPLIEYLIKEGHDVFGTTRSEERAREIAARGGKPLVVNILEKESVQAAVSSVRPDVIIDMLTSLPKDYTPESMQKAAEMDAKVRLEGGGYLQEAAETYSVRRYIVQSCGFWYAPGMGLADESVPFSYDASPGIAKGTKVYAEIERRVLQSTKLEGVALRFGFFYGPRTWYHPNGSMAEQIRLNKIPIIGKGQGIWSFVHIEDAAKAAVSAIYCAPGAYNITNNRPATQQEWLTAFARYLKARLPPHLSEEEAMQSLGHDAVYYATKLRGASNAKAKREFNFEPRTFEWFLV